MVLPLSSKAGGHFSGLIAASVEDAHTVAALVRKKEIIPGILKLIEGFGST